ncbi:anaerobic ribonucleoside-triphosphate reductase [Gracilinema caldarium]|uniref:anaerobic ribonucleoside-triphosphate reductase n=1 Tax=Gracilinema caldarium TaxID=215591 RepID=UPI0002FF55C0|nr:anaerobic ribonucleoside-triphosphate reductase [Gracilinema caldarium]
MRTLEQIEKELAEAREALNQVQGTTTEVYTRIVGYYRSVRNWNKGKRQEYAERKMFRIVAEDLDNQYAHGTSKIYTSETNISQNPLQTLPFHDQSKLLLFVRSACPACPPAKDAAQKLGIPVDFVDADTAEGLSAAARHNVLSTPTAILLDPSGKELARARDAKSILAFAKQGSSQLDKAV